VPIGCKFVLKTKRDEIGAISRRKARLVAKGYSQVFGLDYTETFAPVAFIASILVLLVLCCFNNLQTGQLDVTSAYLDAHLNEEIYMQQPKEYMSKGNEHLVFRLGKSLYGLKQAGRDWYKHLYLILTDLGWARLANEYCIFHRNGSYLVIYVDDIMIFSPTVENVLLIKEQIMMRVNCTDGGELHYILGMRIQRNTILQTIKISQKTLIESLIDKRLANSEVATLPYTMRLKGEEVPANVSEGTVIEYQEVLGSLLYLARYSPAINLSVF
jgi:Reverse transcriptase (RNA-dependent DNA polymerase)